MPAEVLSRIPLPSLRVYTALSVLLVAGCVYYSFSVTSDPSWKQNVNITQHYPPVSLEEALEIKLNGGGGGEEAAAMADREVHRVVESVKGGEMELLSEMQAYEGEGGDYRTIMDLLKDMMSFMGQEAICIWVSGWSMREERTAELKWQSNLSLRPNSRSDLFAKTLNGNLEVDHLIFAYM